MLVLALLGVLDAVAWTHGVHGAFLALLVAAFVAYLLALTRARRASFAAVFVLACAIQLSTLAAPLLASTDAWTYWSYARLHDPYRNTPSQDAVSAPHAGAAYLHSTSVYGPAFALVSEPVAVTRSPDVAAWTFKVAASVAVLLATWLVARRRPFAAALVGWNPVVAVHFGGGGHNDALMVALVAVALALGARGRVQSAGVAWSLAVLVKWVPLLLLPLRALEARSQGRRVGHLGFAVATIVTLAVATALWRLHWLHALVPLSRDAHRATSYALPSRTHLSPWIFAAAFVLAYLRLLRTAARGRARLGLSFGLLLLALPYLIVWYVLWPLALAAHDDDRAAALLSLALCAYLLPQAIV